MIQQEKDHLAFLQQRYLKLKEDITALERRLELKTSEKEASAKKIKDLLELESEIPMSLKDEYNQVLRDWQDLVTISSDKEAEKNKQRLAAYEIVLEDLEAVKEKIYNKEIKNIFVDDSFFIDFNSEVFRRFSLSDKIILIIGLYIEGGVFVPFMIKRKLKELNIPFKENGVSSAIAWFVSKKGYCSKHDLTDDIRKKLQIRYPQINQYYKLEELGSKHFQYLLEFFIKKSENSFNHLKKVKNKKLRKNKLEDISDARKLLFIVGKYFANKKFTLRLLRKKINSLNIAYNESSFRSSLTLGSGKQGLFSKKALDEKVRAELVETYKARYYYEVTESGMVAYEILVSELKEIKS